MGSCSRTSFVKTILPGTIEDDTMKLPLTFATKYMSELGDVAELATPDGKKWEVELMREKKIVWLFGVGWKRFTEHYSVSCGFSLLFWYKGKSKFDVRMYGTSECEMQYHVLPVGRGAERAFNRKRPAFQCKTEVDDDDDIMVVGRKGPSRRQANADSERDAEERATGQKVSKRCKVSRDGNGEPVLDQDAGNNIIIPATIAATLRNAWPETRSAFAAAKASNPKNTAFLVILSGRYAHASYMHVPASFWKEYIDRCTKAVLVRLKSDKGDQKWRLKIIHRDDGLVAFTKGWLQLVKFNNLEQGDVCVFELISAKPLELQVSVFKARSFR